MAYALRIGERLRETSEAATDSYGSALVPLLRRQESAVRTSTSASSRAPGPRGRARTTEPAGRPAATADRATFTAGRISA